jgi:four helix bundle protein
MKYRRFEEVPVWQTGLKLYVSVFTLTAHPLFRGQGDLANQLQRAALSVPNNIAEGFERGSTQELINFLYYARGSAGEVRSILAVAEQLPSLASLHAEIGACKTTAESISRQLGAWLKSLKDTDVTGDRFLSTRERERSKKRQEAREFIEQLRRDTARPAPGAAEESTPHE